MGEENFELTCVCIIMCTELGVLLEYIVTVSKVDCAREPCGTYLYRRISKGGQIMV